MDEQHSSGSGAGADLRGAASEAAEVGRERGRSFVEHRKDAAAQRLHGVAEALRETARKLEGEREVGEVPDLVERAAGGMERLSSALRERDVDGLVADLEDFARRSPALYLGSAAAGGFLLARFLKSSGERRRGEREGGQLLPAEPRSRPPAAGQGAAPRPFGSTPPPTRPHPDPGAFGAGLSTGARPSSGTAGPGTTSPTETS